MKKAAFVSGLMTFFFIVAIMGFAQDKHEEKKDKIVSYGHIALQKIAGKKLYFLKKCNDCHTLAAAAEGKRTPIKKMREPEWFDAHLKEKSEIVLRQEKNRRKRRRVFREEKQALQAFLFAATPEERKQIDAMPENVFAGAYLAYQNRCLRCHSIAGVGKDIGPDLSKVGNKHTKEWFIKNFINPKQFAPDTQMPSFADLPRADLEKIADYLLTLK
ncbi:MAG: cytochrome c [Calditrichaeota bacterium]|nr:MAG: cytochrome c [Calditrichota bacterium]